VCAFYCLAVFVATLTLPLHSSAQTNNEPLGQEYFVQQAANEALLVRVKAFEAEFESAIIGQGGETLLKSGLEGSRIVPIFQYVDAVDQSRQLDVRVSSLEHTERSSFELALTRLTVWDDRSNAVANAYRLLSFGMQLDETKSAANWTVKIDSLMTAGRLFRQFGMKEMRLWANYLAAHLVYQQLHDYSMSYNLNREILAELEGSKFPEIELASLQLQSAVLIGLSDSGLIQRSDNNPDPLNLTLVRAAQLAGDMGLGYEQARALDTLAAYTAKRADFNLALDQYQQALVIAEAVGDAGLLKGIRESILAIHNRQGNAPASSEVLKEIETQLEREGAGDELALNLVTQGRLLIRSFQLGQAIEVLGQALTYQNDSSIRSQIYFELGRASYQSGRWDDAIDYLELAGASPAANQALRGRSTFDYAEALRILANIHRARGESGSANRARVAQGRLAPSKAGYLYEKGLDALSDQAASPRQALALFRQSHAAANEAGSEGLVQLTQLQVCALAGSDPLCTTGKTAYRHLLDSGVPHMRAEAMYLQSQILANEGRNQQALEILQRLADNIHFFRHSVPGALGAWFWERHVTIFEDAIQLMVENPGRPDKMDMSPSLLALSRFRRIANYPNVTPYDQRTDPLRALLAQASDSWPGLASARLNQDIQEALTRLRAPFKKQFEFLSNAGLRVYLQTLNSSESLLTYHVGRDATHVWVARKGRVHHRKMVIPASLEEALADIPHELRYLDQPVFTNTMDRLGEAFVRPVNELLTKTIYWVPAGPLIGIPLDALRLDGRHLVERHQVINLLSVPGGAGTQAGVQTDTEPKMFLAGNPREYSGEYATSLESSEEISVVRDVFVGPGLRIIQGTSLLEDEFLDPRFRTADLIHLAMPGVVNLKYPDQSFLQLSGDELNPRSTFLYPEKIHSQPLEANLVCLNAIKLNGIAASTFNNRVGLVADFLDAGAGSVLAALWGSNELASRNFLDDFYRRLKSNGQVQDALLAAKRNSLRTNPDGGLNTWAAYQLFID
jgi:CHAT domain-containing protein